MSIGRTCPRNQEYLLLYPRSVELKEAVCEYFIVTVQLCKQAVMVLKKPLLVQLFSAMSNTIVWELGGFEQRLSQLASAVAAEVSLASKRLQVQEAEQSSIFRLSASAIPTQNKKWGKQKRTLRFLDACSNYDYQAAWKQARKQGNVYWFLEETAYTDWIATPASSVLLCVGTLGSGKSVLAANVVDHLILHCQPALVAYFFCKYDDAESLSAKTIIGSIARQILEQLKLDLDDLTTDFNTKTLKTEGILDILKNLLSTHVRSTQIFCIVLDGVDYCMDADATEVIDRLARLVRSSSHIFHIFCSSRPDVFHSVHNALQPDHTLSMSAPRASNDMNQYIVEALEEALETGRLILNNPEIITKIRDTLVGNANGM
jgi:Cdc6-like AAA superfamily ATPase